MSVAPPFVGGLPSMVPIRSAAVCARISSDQEATGLGVVRQLAGRAYGAGGLRYDLGSEARKIASLR